MSTSHSQQTSDSTRAESLHHHLHLIRSDLMDSGIYIGDPTNQFRQDVVWKRHGRADHLVFKEVETENETENRNTDLSSTIELTPATLSVVVLASYEDCWLIPCGNWKGPTQVTKKFEDLKLSFVGERPVQFDVFQKDYNHVLMNVKWLMQQISVPNAKSKGFLNTSRTANAESLKFRHALFEKREEDSCDTSSESDDSEDEMYQVANWPVIHNEAAEARDNIAETHRLVPLPVYDTNGVLIPPSRYKDAVPQVPAKQ